MGKVGENVLKRREMFDKSGKYIPKRKSKGIPMWTKSSPEFKRTDIFSGEKSILDHFCGLRREWLTEEVKKAIVKLNTEKKNVVQKIYGREFIETSFAISHDPKFLKEPHIRVYEVPSNVFYDKNFGIYWRSTGSWD